MNTLKVIAGRLLEKLGLTIMSRKSMMASKRLSVLGFHKILWMLRQSPHSESFTQSQKDRILSNFQSQLGQDVFALSLLGPHQRGFFVEFGATNGVALSNSFLLETEFHWSGILCEPAMGWKSHLVKNRTAAIDTRCVFSESGLSLSFSETSIPELSTIDGFGESDESKVSRRSRKTYEVETVSLLDLLREHNAPNHIDFLSVDTEGSEFEILNAFDFSKYSFGAICVEHNYTATRAKVRDLLLSKGYRQVYSELSDFDDWFVLSTNQNSLS